MFKGVKKMVVADNLLYVLDTEVSFRIPPVDTVSNTIEWLLHNGKFIWQDTLSLWDLHFLVVIHCWPDLAIRDFELITECGSASMVSWVSLSYIAAVHNILNDVYQNKLNLSQPRQGKHEDNSVNKARHQSGKCMKNQIMLISLTKAAWEVHLLHSLKKFLLISLRSIFCKSDVCRQWVFAILWTSPLCPVLSKQN